MLKANRTSIFLLGACSLISACDSVMDRKDFVEDTVKSWNGKDVHVALDALGPPDKTQDGHGKRLYTWTTARQESMHIVGGRVIPIDGTTDASDPGNFNTLVTCTINVVENTDSHIIVGVHEGGQIRVCAQFADRIRAAGAPAPTNDK